MSPNELKKKKQQQTNKKFVELLSKKLQEKEGQEVGKLIEWLVQHNLIRTSIINRFMVVNMYPDELEKTKSEQNPRGVKRTAIWNLSDELPLCETAICNIITNYSYFFKKNRLKFP